MLPSKWSALKCYTANMMILISGQNQEFQRVYDTIKLKARKFSENVPLIQPSAATVNGTSCTEMVMCKNTHRPVACFTN